MLVGVLFGGVFAGSPAWAQVEPAVLHERDTHLGPVERELARRLKRVLADEQNEVFDLLRRDTPERLDDVVPAAAEHAQRYADAALADLDAAALSGAATGFVCPSGSPGSPPD